MKKNQIIYFTSFLSLIPFGCSSPQQPEGSEQKSITSTAEAIPLTAPVEFAEDLNQVVEDPGVIIDQKKKDSKKENENAQADKAKDAGVAAEDSKKSDDLKKVTKADQDSEKDQEKDSSSVNRKIASTKSHTIIYTVKSGDTLMKVSFNVFGDLTRWREVYDANKKLVKNPNVLTEGTKLKIKVFNVVAVKHNGEAYPIKRGDTLGKISKWIYGTISHWRDLWNNNRELIHNPNKIYAGFKLYYLKNKLAKEVSPSPDLIVASEKLSAEAKLEEK